MTTGDWIGLAGCFLTVVAVMATGLSAMSRRLDRVEARLDRALELIPPDHLEA